MQLSELLVGPVERIEDNALWHKTENKQTFCDRGYKLNIFFGKKQMYLQFAIDTNIK